MSFDWSDYLSLAEDLSKRTEESCQRTAISRAYYYIYHLARQRLKDNDFVIVMGGDTHKQVWEKYANDPDPRCQMLHELAKQLHDKRKQADYDVPFRGKLDAELPALLGRARKFATDLASLDKRRPVNSGVRR